MRSSLLLGTLVGELDLRNTRAKQQPYDVACRSCPHDAVAAVTVYCSDL